MIFRTARGPEDEDHERAWRPAVRQESAIARWRGYVAGRRRDRRLLRHLAGRRQVGRGGHRGDVAGRGDAARRHGTRGADVVAGDGVGTLALGLGRNVDQADALAVLVDAVALV